MVPDFFLSCGAFLNHNLVNKPAENSKRMLIAAVFHFVDQVQKKGKNITRWLKTLSASAISEQVADAASKFSTWILLASAPVHSYSMPFSSSSFPSLFTYKQMVWIQSAIVCCHNKNSLLETEQYGHKILMQWSSWSKHVFDRDNSHAISCAISRQEKGELHKRIALFITYPSPAKSVRAYATSWPNFLTHGAPLARIARRSSANMKYCHDWRRSLPQ